MSITHMPRKGPIREKDYADYFAAIGTVSTGRADSSGSFILDTYGLTVYVKSSAGAGHFNLNGYSVMTGGTNDLAVSLPPHRISYVYAVLDMAGYTNTVGQRLVAYGDYRLIPNGMLIARCTTNATTVTTIEYVADTAGHMIYTYRYDTAENHPAPKEQGGASFLFMLPAVLGVAGKTPTRLYRLTTERLGTMSVQFKLCTGKVGGEAHLKIYVTSTGDTPQVDAVSTATLGKDFDETLAVQAGDIIEIEMYNKYADQISYCPFFFLTWYAMTPWAPAWLKEI